MFDLIASFIMIFSPVFYAIGHEIRRRRRQRRGYEDYKSKVKTNAGQ